MAGRVFGSTKPTFCLHSLKNAPWRTVLFSTKSGGRDGLVVGVYQCDEDNENKAELTKVGKIIDKRTNGKFSHQLKLASKKFKVGKSRLFYDIDEEYPVIAAVSVGKRQVKKNELECFDERKENLRLAAAVGVRSLRDLGVSSIQLDPCHDAKAIAEGATLSKFAFDYLKQEAKRQKPVAVKLFDFPRSQDSLSFKKPWQDGCILSEGQNFARELSESPPNLLTPRLFADKVVEKFAERSSVEVIVREKPWIEDMKMGAFLCVAQGSCELPYLVEVKYFGAENKQEPPLVLVGKGITFDSGGISIKPAANMAAMKGDMGGAASCAGAMKAIARLELPLNIIVLLPLCENMPSGSAVKPGDVVKAMNGKTIEVDNTDAEGRLILADALTYAHSFNPKSIIDVATLTGAMDVALGAGASGVFCNSDELWKHFKKAGYSTGDRVWRMPLFQLYNKHVQSDWADLINVGKKRSAGACTAAAFLKEFVDCASWAHLDIAGVMQNTDEVSYLGKGMSGRSTRTLVELATRLCRQ